MLSKLCKRLIPCLDVANGRTVKGVNFQGLRDVGDPVELAMRYEEEGADEQRQRVVDRVLVDAVHLEHALTLCLPLFDHAPTAAGQTRTLSKL